MIKIKFILCILHLLFSLNVFSVQEDPFNSYIVQIPSKHGDSKINIAIKDYIDLAGFPTTAGSLALANNIASKSAFLISKLEKANYHINGKTNLSEWANFRSEKSVSGWSSYGGQTTNPYGKELNPCGSSSGSAVAVASGLVKIAVGTETNGSISCPASVNGIVGLKPTVGLISRHGIIPISPTQDTAGPMGETVEVVAAALQAMSGRDVNDPATSNIPANFDFNFIKNLKENGVAGKRFGLLSSGRDNEDAAKLLDRIQKLITRLGGTVIEIEDSRQYPGSDEYFLLLYEFKVSLEKYLLQSSSSFKSLESLIKFNNDNEDAVMPFFKQEIFLKSQETMGKEKDYQQALEMVSRVRGEFNEMLIRDNLDGFIGLTRNPAWKIDYAGGDDAAMANQISFGNGAFAAIAGYPHLTVPLASINNLPVGISIIGPAWSETILLQVGYELEKNKNKF